MRGQIKPSGSLGLKVIRRNMVRTSVPDRELSFAEVLKYAAPQKGLSREVNAWRLCNWRKVWKGYKRVVTSRLLNLPTYYGKLSLVKIGADGSVVDYGLAGFRVVTDAGVGFIVDAFQNTVELENMKFHGIGTGSTAEAAGDTALVTELTTQYSADNTRATGTTEEGATANIYKTVATNTVDAAVGIQEHGIFDQAATGGGVLLDRTVFTVVNLADGDSLQSTYELTFPSGS